MISEELLMKLSFGKACIPREDGYEPGEKSLFSIIIGKHMKMLCFKFPQYRTINKEFDF